MSIEDINRELLTLQERLDHVYAKAIRADGKYDFTPVTIYGDISNEAKAERFIADQCRYKELLDKRVAEVVDDGKSLLELVKESKALVAGSGTTRGDLATRLAVALKSAPAGSVQGGSFDPPELKALMTTSAGYPPETLRSGRVEVTPTRPTLVMDLPPMIRTVQNAFKYVRETTFTNAAAEVAEGGAYPEASLAYTEVTEPVQKVAVHIPVTEEQLEDDPAVEDLIRARLAEMIRQRLDSQLLNGNGTAPNLRGVRNVSGINAVSQGTDTILDAIYKGIVACRTVGYAQPDAIVIHPTNLQAVRLAKSTDGQYLFGPPSSSLNMPIWGLRVVETSAIPAGKVVIGDWANYSALAMRSNIDIQVGYSGTGFTAGIKTVRLDLRAAFAVFRPSAFAEVTLA